MQLMISILLGLGVFGKAYGLLNVSAEGWPQFGPYTTTRYSRFIGDFEAECFIEANATFLKVGENPCSSSTIASDLQDKIVFLSFTQDNIRCFEETMYLNLERLGAAAILNFDPFPAGATLNRLNWGKARNDGSIPFLDLGAEFMDEVYTELADSSVEIQATISGCGDPNPYIKCVNRIQPILIATVSIPSFLGIILAKSALDNTKHTHLTAPRIYVLRVTLAFSVFLFISSATNLPSTDGYFWITDGLMYTQLSQIALSMQICMYFYTTVLSAYYWSYLKDLCFVLEKDNKTSCCKKFAIYNQSRGFFGRIEFKILNIFLAVFIISLTTYLLQLHAKLDNVIIFIVLGDFLILLGLLYAHYGFIEKATALIVMTDGIAVKSVQTRRYKRYRVLDNITGRSLRLIIQSKPSDENSTLSHTATRLTLELGYYLQVYFVLFLVFTGVVAFMIVSFDLENASQDDPLMNNCLFVVPDIMVFGSRVIMNLPLILGIRGPAPKKIGVTNQQIGTQVMPSKKKTVLISEKFGSTELRV